MKHTIQRCLSILTGLALVMGSYFSVAAAPEAQTTSNVYISAVGSGSTCTQSTPCSMSTGIKLLSAGKTLVLSSGTYSSTLQITASGTSSQPIKVTGPAVVKAVVISGSYIEVSGLEVAGASSHGVAISGKHIKFSNFSVHDTVNENKSGSACSGSGSWGSGLKISVGGEDIQLSNGQIFHNCGEGLAITRGINVTITNVTAYDNFSANFYLDNSKQVTLQRSFSYCTTNTNYYRSGQPASSILIGEEYYSGWGGQLGSLTIVNNVSFGCKGLSFYGVESGVPNPGLVGALIAHNTIWKVYNNGKAISISSQPGNQGIVIGNNIVAGSISGANATLKNNQSTATFATTPGYTKTSFLPAANSAGVNAGAALGVPVDTDNATRDNNPDVGAWEVTGAVAQPTATKVPATATKVPATPTNVAATATKAPATATRAPSTATLVPATPTQIASTPTSVSQPPAQVNVRIAASNNDAEEDSSGNMYVDSTDLEMIYDLTPQTVGMRFPNINVPQGARIVNAYIQFKVDETASSALSLAIQGEASGNAAAFTTAARNITSRPRTASSVAWTPAGWSTVGATGAAQATPNLSAIVQEIVNQSTWSAGNAMVVFVSGTSEKRVAEAYDGDPAGAPLLHIEYTTGSAMPFPGQLESPILLPSDVPTETPSPTVVPPTETPIATETPTQEVLPPSETATPTETPSPTLAAP